MLLPIMMFRSRVQKYGSIPDYYYYYYYYLNVVSTIYLIVFYHRWPKIAQILAESDKTVKRIQQFSYSILLNPHSERF